MSRRKIPALAAPLIALMAALACRPNESLEGQARDARVKTEVKSKLASQVDASTLTSVEVNVTNGVVTLAGPVHSSEESQRIESVARGVEGVTEVKNALQILAPDRNVTPSAGAVPEARTSPTK